MKTQEKSLVQDYIGRKAQRWYVSLGLLGFKDLALSTLPRCPPNLQNQIPLPLLLLIPTPGIPGLLGGDDYPTHN